MNAIQVLLQGECIPEIQVVELGVDDTVKDLLETAGQVPLGRDRRRVSRVCRGRRQADRSRRQAAREQGSAAGAGVMCIVVAGSS